MGIAHQAVAEAALDALGDPTRRSILRLLTEQPRSVQEVADRLPVSRPAVSQHLRVLRGAGLVTSTQQGTRHIYRLDADGAAAARDFLDEMWSVALSRFALLADNTTPAVPTRPCPETGGSVMNPTETVTPIVKTLELSCSRDHAFFVYTERIADWWPVGDFSVSGAEATVIIEGRVGGRILEVSPDGAEHPWGEIDTWDPTGGLGHTWHPGSDPARATRVDVTFTATVGGCEVTLVHSGWAATPEAEQSRRGYGAGWDEVLAAYMAATA